MTYPLSAKGRIEQKNPAGPETQGESLLYIENKAQDEAQHKAEDRASAPNQASPEASSGQTASQINRYSDAEASIQAVNVNLLLEFNRELAREVRLSGSEEELRAFEYAQSKLDEWGLSTELTFDEAYISLPGKVDFQAGGEQIEAITHSMAAAVEGLETVLVVSDTGGESRGLASTKANATQRNADKRNAGQAAVYSLGAGALRGSGADPVSHFAPGHAVLLDGLAGWPSVRKWEQAGASAVVFVNSGEHVHEMIVSSVWGNPQPDDQDQYVSIPVISINREAGARLKHLIAGAGGELPIHLSAQVDTGWRNIPTLTAELRGVEEPDRFVLFSGHIDSWHYGAMDNASANAVMLETARVLAAQPEPPRRTLRLAFWSGHSHGRYAGSALYADRHHEELSERGVLHLNIDSVGGQGASLLSAANIMAETTGLAAEAIRGVTESAEFEGRPLGRAGDQSFWGTGIPSAFMGLSYQPDGWFGWWWHTTEDTLDKIDPANLERDARIYVAAAHRAINAPLLPLDHRESVKAIRARLIEYAQVAEDRLDLEVLLNRAGELQNETERLYRTLNLRQQAFERLSDEYELSRSGYTAGSGYGSGNGKAPHLIAYNDWFEKANKHIHRLSKAVVPIGYVKGGRFEPDPALPQPFVPALAEIEEFAQAEYGSDAFYRLRTLLIRRANRLADELKQAIAIAKQAVEELEA
ncbi:M28 family peptidase [Saccharibacillus sacchari]|uniref:M28 family peptidase n=1 Tax=Saccharibacillus sacchari TaxID=456493 RepID=A0ACC6PD74_9BACL